MIIDRPLEALTLRLGFGLAGLVAIALFGYLTSCQFVVATLTDGRARVPPELLERASQFLPGSAALNGRLAVEELARPRRDLDLAELHARQAIAFSPFDFRFRLTMAELQDARGDLDGSEQSLRAALNLAPNETQAHWRLANLLLREGKLALSAEHFRITCTTDPSLLPVTLDLIWRATDRNMDIRNIDSPDSQSIVSENAARMSAIAEVTPDDFSSRLILARFLASKSCPADAARIFKGIDPAIRRQDNANRGFIDNLFDGGNPSLARFLWADTLSPGAVAPIIWNGSFETGPDKRLPEFDWTLGDTKYAKIAIDARAAHSGSRSLRIEFAGLDTTKLTGEVHQSLVLTRGARYRLSYFVKTDKLVTPEGPRVLLLSPALPDWAVTSPPVPSGIGDWREITVEFVAPVAEPSRLHSVQSDKARVLQNDSGGPQSGFSEGSPEKSVVVVISIVRKPEFSYDEPTRGTIWFDDFVINALER